MNLGEARDDDHLGRRTVLRAIPQDTEVPRGPARHLPPIDGHSTKPFPQYLVSSTLNPRTVLLAGYSDNDAGATGLALTQSNRRSS
jgi:hypothetical protein